VKARGGLGIRAKLFFAFAAVSGTTVIAGIAAWLMFAQVRDLFHGVAGRSIPDIVGTLGLQTETQALSGAAPTLLAAKTPAQEQRDVADLKGRQEVIAKRLDAIAAARTDQASIDRLKTQIAAMNGKLAALDRAVADRLKLSAPQMEWLLQVLNDIRVGSWLVLGEPDEKKGKPIEVNDENARYYAAMEFCGLFQMTLLDALQQSS